MNDRELDQLLRRAQPESAARVPALAFRLREANQELLEDIMSGSSPDLVPEPLSVKSPDPATVVPRPRRIAGLSSGRRWFVGAGAAAAVVVAILVPTAVFVDQGQDPVPPVASATEPATESATTNPYILLKAAGWSVSHVDEETRSDGVHGQLSFVSDRAGLSMEWSPAENYRDDVQSTRDLIGKPDPIEFLGQDAELWDQGAGEFKILAQIGRATVSVTTSQMPDRQTLEQNLGRLSRVTPQAWFDAMPSTAVVPPQSVAVGEQIIRDVTLPDDFDTSILASDLTRSRVDFGETVMGRVTCAWLDDYEKAHEAGNDKGMTRVSEALATVRDSSFIRSVGEEAALPTVYDGYVQDTAAGKDVKGTSTAEGCTVRVG